MTNAAKGLDELSRIDFATSAEFFDYCKRARTIARDFAFELYQGSGEAEAAMSTIPSVAQVKSRIRAKFVARHIKRAAAAQQTAAVSMVKAQAAFRKHFGPELAAAGARKQPTKPQMKVVA